MPLPAALKTGDGPYLQRPGSFVARARVTAKASAAGLVVGLSIWWKKLASDGKNANEVTSQRLTDMGRAPTFYDTLVQVEKAAP
jgi:anaerobic selenocysteine-containing dehydrogenase